jgi:putative transposase
MTYWRLFYHLVWSTFERRPDITPDVEKLMYRVIYDKADELEVKIHAAGNVEDHVHLVVSIPPKVSVAKCVGQLKGISSFTIERMQGRVGLFRWQEGYGAITFGERSLETICQYAKDQKIHHLQKNTIAHYEREEE